MTERAIVVVRRNDVAIVVEVQEARAVTVRRSRPTAAAVADKAQTAIVEVSITRSRVPDGRCRTELAGKVHALV